MSSLLNFLRYLKSKYKKSPVPPVPPVKEPVVIGNNDMPFGTGGKKSPPDYRDVPYASVASVFPLPPLYIEDILALPVWHQKKNGSCVGHSGGKYKQYLDFLETGLIIPLSARFLYALAKCRDKFSGQGTYPRLVAKILENEGCATETTVPNDSGLDHESYVYSRNEENIPKSAFTEAKRYKIKSYAFLNVKNINELKRGIVDGRGTMLLMRIGAEWWSKNGRSSWDEKDIIPLLPPKEIVSGHEVYLYGYEDLPNGRTKFYIFNSWSAAWGKSGTAWFDYDDYKPFLDEAITFVDLPNMWIEELHKLPTKESFKHSFGTNLKLGQRNDEVKAVQTALLIEGLFSADLYKGLMDDPKGLGYYGDVTRRAVLAFQTRHHVDSQPVLDQLAGRVAGPKTRAKLNQLYS